ncbi:MAG TPA: hypothetical protein QGI71_11985 [Dehalococcoidia bacterium]|jgi:APA family basic amino acid/polyamine antiporter|nr:hypothetical protein [Dehalococcoidia bacterium]
MTLLVIAFSAAIVMAGTRETVTVVVAMAGAEAAGLVFVIAVGLPDVGSRSLFYAPNGAAGIVAGAALVFFAFEGFEQIATLSEEAKNPTRTIPAVLYGLVAVTAVSVIAWESLVGSESPLADV